MRLWKVLVSSHYFVFLIHLHDYFQECKCREYEGRKSPTSHETVKVSLAELTVTSLPAVIRACLEEPTHSFTAHSFPPNRLITVYLSGVRLEIGFQNDDQHNSYSIPRASAGKLISHHITHHSNYQILV